jgi:hypothetical protein
MSKDFYDIQIYLLSLDLIPLQWWNAVNRPLNDYSRRILVINYAPKQPDTISLKLSERINLERKLYLVDHKNWACEDLISFPSRDVRRGSCVYHAKGWTKNCNN